MCNAIDPGSERTTRLESFETAPQHEVDFLQEFAPFLRVGLVPTHQTAQGRTMFRCGPFIQVVLPTHI
jgi:hypothetical protein